MKEEEEQRLYLGSDRTNMELNVGVKELEK